MVARSVVEPERRVGSVHCALPRGVVWARVARGVAAWYTCDYELRRETAFGFALGGETTHATLPYISWYPPCRSPAGAAQALKNETEREMDLKWTCGA